MNLVTSGNYPYVQFQPSETSGVEHTDQEFTDGSGNSYLFRMYNAWFDPSGPNWKTLGGGSDAYATVQNPDGSIHYYWNGGTSPWTTWLGSDNNTIYNAVDFGTTAGGSASVNTAALISVFTAMGTFTAPALGGGTARIPQYNFPVNASLTGLPVTDQAIIQGLGTGGEGHSSEAFHFSINDLIVPGPFIFLNCSGTHTSGGTLFKNLAFQWLSPGYNGDTCLYFNFWNNSAQECTFTDCPIAINFQGLAGSAVRCTIRYGKYITTPTNVTGIVVAGIQTEISGPSEMNMGGLTGSTTTTFMSITGNVATSSHNTLRNLHIFKCNYGVDYSDINDLNGSHGGTQNTVIDGCHFECSTTCINMVPNNSTGQIFNQTITNNLITKGQDSTDGAPIVFIDSDSGVNANIGPIDLVNNTIFSNVTGGSGQGGMGGHTGVAQNNQYGVQIGNCAAVSIIGGHIFQMGGNNTPTGTANICISGDPDSVIIDSVDLSAVYDGANHGTPTGSTGSAASYYGLLISGSPGRVLVNNCNLTGVTVPVSVTGTPINLSITNCPGYNNQNTVINTIAHITTAMAYSAATQGSNGGTSYYGPSLVMFTANAFGGSFQVNGGTALTLLPTQVVTLTLASPYDTIQFNTHVPAAIQWTGR